VTTMMEYGMVIGHRTKIDNVLCTQVNQIVQMDAEERKCKFDVYAFYIFCFSILLSWKNKT
jgi:hypothetical protein